MLSFEEIQQAALILHSADQSRTSVGQLSQRFPHMTIEDAYAIQSQWLDIRLGEGETVRGHKIGLTSRAMQMASNITEPDYGTLLDSMFYDEGQDIDISRFIDPKIEVELAFVLAKPLKGPNVTVFDVLNATDYVVPALEIIDARIERTDKETGRARKVIDTISDNAANAGVVVGGRAIRPDEIDLRWVSALLFRNSVIEETGVAAGVLNHPAYGVSWLCRKFALFDKGLEAGQIILSGSFTRPVNVHEGDVFHADYGDLGSISCRFVRK